MLQFLQPLIRVATTAVKTVSKFLGGQRSLTSGDAASKTEKRLRPLIKDNSNRIDGTRNSVNRLGKKVDNVETQVDDLKTSNIEISSKLDDLLNKDSEVNKTDDKEKYKDNLRSKISEYLNSLEKDSNKINEERDEVIINSSLGLKELEDNVPEEKLPEDLKKDPLTEKLVNFILEEHKITRLYIRKLFKGLYLYLERKRRSDLMKEEDNIKKEKSFKNTIIGGLKDILLTSAGFLVADKIIGKTVGSKKHTSVIQKMTNAFKRRKKEEVSNDSEEKKKLTLKGLGASISKGVDKVKDSPNIVKTIIDTIIKVAESILMPLLSFWGYFKGWIKIITGKLEYYIGYVFKFLGKGIKLLSGIITSILATAITSILYPISNIWWQLKSIWYFLTNFLPNLRNLLANYINELLSKLPVVGKYFKNYTPLKVDSLTKGFESPPNPVTIFKNTKRVLNKIYGGIGNYLEEVGDFNITNGQKMADEGTQDVLDLQNEPSAKEVKGSNSINLSEVKTNESNSSESNSNESEITDLPKPESNELGEVKSKSSEVSKITNEEATPVDSELRNKVDNTNDNVIKSNESLNNNISKLQTSVSDNSPSIINTPIETKIEKIYIYSKLEEKINDN